MTKIIPTPSTPTPLGTSQNYKIDLRPRRPRTGPQNGDSRKVLAGVLAQVLAKMGVLARVLAQVLASCSVSVFPKGPTCQRLCQHSGQHPHFCQHLCQHPSQHFSGIPIFGVLYQVAGISKIDNVEILEILSAIAHFPKNLLFHSF